MVSVPGVIPGLLVVDTSGVISNGTPRWRFLKKYVTCPGVPLTKTRKVPFNMSAYINEYDNCHCWEGTQGETWEVDKAGTLHFK